MPVPRFAHGLPCEQQALVNQIDAKRLRLKGPDTRVNGEKMGDKSLGIRFDDEMAVCFLTVRAEFGLAVR
jgi:hypothetical protein